MKKTILIALSVFVLCIGLYRHFAAPDEVPPTTSNAQVTDDDSQPVSHAKPLPPGCATVECKGIKGHVSEGDAYLRAHIPKPGTGGLGTEAAVK